MEKYGAVRRRQRIKREARGGVARAVDIMNKELDSNRTRTRLVPGFYNISLTTDRARSANPAWFIDVNCDLYVSTKQALGWIFQNNLARHGTLILYDDWQNTPFGEGESLAHMEIANEFKVDFSVAWEKWNECNLVVFRVESIGQRNNSGIPEKLKKFKVVNK